MRLLIDTHLLIWAGDDPSLLPRAALALLDDPAHERLFSSLSVAEVAIKRAKGLSDFLIDPADFRATLLANKFAELPLTGAQAVRLRDLRRSTRTRSTA